MRDTTKIKLTYELDPPELPKWIYLFSTKEWNDALEASLKDGDEKSKRLLDEVLSNSFDKTANATPSARMKELQKSCDERFDKLEKSSDERFDKLENKLEKLEASLKNDERFDKLEKQL